MPQVDRRAFVGTVSLAGLAGLTGSAPAAHTVETATRSSAQAALATDVTRTIAQYVVSGSYADLPSAVCKEARRTLLNWMGCAVGGSRHEALDAAISALAPFSGPPRASVLGRRERMDILNASLMNAQTPSIVALRDRVTATIDNSIKEDQVRAIVTTKDGRTFDKFVEHVVGSLERPMSDKDLEAKFMGLADGVLPPDQTRRLMELCWSIETLPSVGELAAAARVN